MHSLHRVYYIFFILQTLAWTSCQKNDKPSILVIAIDKLSSDLATCTDNISTAKSGVNLLCKESVRFTHSYTTSTHSAAAMASVLTGEYPLQHHLFRSYDRLNPASTSVAEIAKKNNYVTSFFSGSPFILKKTGLSDYFDIFDDTIASSKTSYEQDFKQQSDHFFQWQQTIRQPFFSVIYSSELNKLTRNETDVSSFEKLDEKLYSFFLELKKKKLWEDTYIVLIGLNGNNKFNRTNSNFIFNLHSENTNVVTLIKIPRKKGDEGVYWKNDFDINLADIGFTLACLIKNCSDSNPTASTLENKTSPINQNLFPILNLNSILNSKNFNLNKKNFNRALLIQTTDTADLKRKVHNFSIVHNQYNIIQNGTEGYKIYNMISDKTEIVDIANNSESVLESKKYIDSLSKHTTPELNSNDPSAIQKVNTYAQLVKDNFEYWSLVKSNTEIEKDTILAENPLLYYYIQKIQRQKNKKIIEDQIQKIKTNVLSQNACPGLLLKTKISKDDLKICNDDFFLQYLLYIKASDFAANAESNKLLYSLMKTNYRNNINRQSTNLAHSNAWGLYTPQASLIHPLVFIDPYFFDN